jgi:hypothetical protein
VAFPDVAGLVISYLDGLVADPVASRVPDPRPARFVQVRRIGGLAQEPVRDRARLDVHCWAGTDPDAMALALDIRAHMWALSGTDLLGPMTYQVGEFLSPRHQDDDLTGNPRVWATYELTVRADDVIQPAPSIAS